MEKQKEITDPTYLRSIRDGLLSGSIQRDNPTALPFGLAGIYEQALPPAHRAGERQRFLEFFGVWALLKKEVSAGFVAEILEEPEDEILNFISAFSAWFNSPEIGKYQLYHQRIKTHLLTKSNANLLNRLNKKIIERIENAIYGSEIEHYGLEWLGDHLLNELDDGKYESILKRLIRFTLNQDFIDRQYEVDPTLSTAMKNVRTAILLNGYACPATLDKNIIRAWNYILKLRQEEFKNSVICLVKDGKGNSFFKNLSFYDDERLKFRLYNYVLRAYISSSEIRDESIYNEFVEFSSREFTRQEQFNWYCIFGITENFLIETYFQVYLCGFDVSTLLNLGHFDLSAIFYLIDSHKGKAILIPFILDLTSRFDVSKRSETHLQIISRYHSILQDNELRIINAQIDQKLLRLKSEMFLTQSLKKLLNEDQQLTFSLLADAEKLEFMYFLVKNIGIQKTNLIRKFFQLNIYLIDPVKIPGEISVEMDQDQIWLSEDRSLNDWINELSKKVSVLLFLDNQAARDLLETAINETDHIKNGGIKGSLLNKLFDEFRLHNDEEIQGLSAKAKAKIPRIRVGGLGYGQFLADNMIDLFEEEYDFGDHKKARGYLLKAEKEISNLKISVKRDETRLRLIRKFLLINERKRAIRQVGLIENQKIHFEAVQAIFSSCKKNNLVEIANLKKIIYNELETRFYFEFLLNNQGDQNFTTTLFHFIDSLAPAKKGKEISIGTINAANLALNSVEPKRLKKVNKFIFDNFLSIDNFSSLVHDKSFDENLDIYRTLLHSDTKHTQKLRLILALEGRKSEAITLFKQGLFRDLIDHSINSFIMLNRESCSLSINTYEKGMQVNKTLPAILSIRMRKSELKDRWDELIPYQKYTLSGNSIYLNLGPGISHLEELNKEKDAETPSIKALFFAVQNNNFKMFELVSSRIKIPGGVQLKLLVNYIQHKALSPGVFLKVLFKNIETRIITKAYYAQLLNQLQYSQVFTLRRHDFFFATFILDSGNIIHFLNKRLKNVR